jgi:hypothetical protein
MGGGFNLPGNQMKGLADLSSGLRMRPVQPSPGMTGALFFL